MISLGGERKAKQKKHILSSSSSRVHNARHTRRTTRHNGMAPPTNDEAVYRRWFPLADEDGDGRVTGGDAVKFFSLSGLPKETLARVWQLSDVNRQGFLGVDHFVKALRVIALAQQAGGWGADPAAVTNDALEKALVAGTLGVAKMQGLDGEVDGENNNSPGGGNNLNDPFNMSGVSGGLPGAGGLGGASGASSYGTAGGGSGGGGGGGGVGKKSKINAKTATSIVDSLKEIYKAKVRPVEEALKFGSFYSPLLTDGDFEGKPNVLLLGKGRLIHITTFGPLIHTLVHSLVLRSIYSSMHPTTFGPLVHTLVHSLVDWSIHWLIGPFIRPCTPPHLVHSSIHWSIHCFIGSLVHWSMHSSIHAPPRLKPASTRRCHRSLTS